MILKEYLLKTLKLYLIWTVVYFPLAIYHFVSESIQPIQAVLLYLRGFFLVGEQYNSWPLWYLLSTIYALLWIILLLKHNLKFRWILYIGALIFLISIFITFFTGYNGNLPTPILFAQKILQKSIVQGRIFIGMFYIPVGMYFSKQSLPNHIAWILTICGFLTNAVIENTIISSVLIAITTIGLFDIITKLRLSNLPFYYMARKMSTVIYFIHMYVWSIYYKLVYGEKTFGFDCFVVTSFICITIAFIYVYVWQKRDRIESSRQMPQ